MQDQALFTEFPPITTEEWEAVIQQDLKGADYNKKLLWKTLEGFDVKPYYRAEDLEKLSFLDARPKEMPFVRGQKETHNQWDIRENPTVNSFAELKQAVASALNRGVDAIGLDMRWVKTPAEMHELLSGINLGKVKLHFCHAASYKETLQQFAAYLKSQNINGESLRGSIDYDPFAYALRHGRFWQDEQFGYKEWTEILDIARAVVPHFDLLTVHGSIFHNAGSTIVEELGFTLAAAHDYLYHLTELKVAPHSVGYRMVFSFATGSNYFMEIAKIRAARLLWTTIMQQYCPQCQTAYDLHVHAESSAWNKTLYDSHVNLLRTTTETMSAAIGGADSITVLPFDGVYAQASEFSSRIATNQQILLKSESYIDKVADPSAGSYYIETLTDSIAAHAWDIFKEVEAAGGFAHAITTGMVQSRIQATAKQRNKDIATRKTIVLGTNQYPHLGETGSDRSPLSPAASATPPQGTIPVLRPCRGAEAFEQLRRQTEQSGKRPKIFLLTYGNLAMRKARAGFATNFFGVAGYDVIDNPGFSDLHQAATEALQAKADVVVFCSSDEEYLPMVETLCPLLKGKVAAMVVAGNPTECADAFQKAGIDEFIHVRTNVLESLQGFQQRLIS